MRNYLFPKGGTKECFILKCVILEKIRNFYFRGPAPQQEQELLYN